MGDAQHTEAPVTSAAAGVVPLLRERLAGDPGGRPFAEAVLAQLVGPAGALADTGTGFHEALALHISEILLASPGAGRDDALAHRLLAEPALAAAFFQNLDLLFTHGSVHAEAIGALVMRTVELAAAADESAPPL